MLIINFEQIPDLAARRAVLRALQPLAAINEDERVKTAAVTARHAPGIAQQRAELAECQRKLGVLSKALHDELAPIEDAAEQSRVEIQSAVPHISSLDTDDLTWMYHDDGTPHLCALTGLPIHENDETTEFSNEDVLKAALFPIDKDGEFTLPAPLPLAVTLGEATAQVAA